MRPAKPGTIGAFVLGAIAIAIGVVLFFGSSDMFARTIRAVVFFEGSVGGLMEGAPVTFRGVRVGSVAGVSLVLNPKDMSAHIPVYLRLEPGRVALQDGSVRLQDRPTLERMVQAGLRAKLVSQSFVTGQMQIELDLAPQTPARLLAGGEPGVPEIPAVPSDLEQLRQQITQAPIAQTIAQADRTLAAIERLANVLDTELPSLTESVHRTLDSATRTSDIAGASIQHLDNEVSTTLLEFKALAHDGREQLAARGAELRQTLELTDHALRSANTLLTSANGLVAVNSPAREDLEATLRDLAASASSLRNFSRTVERDPSALLLSRFGH
jgi:paraquat-inducible protein B